MIQEKLLKLCKYDVEEPELRAKVSFLLVFLIITTGLAFTMSIVRFLQNNMFQTLLDAFVGLAAIVGFLSILSKKSLIMSVVRILFVLILIALYVGIFFAAFTVSSVLGILVALASLHLFVNNSEFIIWAFLYLFGLVLGNNFLVQTPLIENSQLFIISGLITIFFFILQFDEHMIAMNKKYEAKLAEDKRNALLAKMVSMISHQWRQPLSTITAITSKEVLKAELDKLDKEQLVQDFKKIEAITMRLAETIGVFRDVFEVETTRNSYPIENIFKDIMDGLNRIYFDLSVEQILDISTDLSVLIRKKDIEKAINLILENTYERFALHKSDGCLKITATEEEGTVLIFLENNAGRIEADDLDQVFDPYFSTKKQNQGVGLGLFMAKAMIRKNGGDLTVENTEDGVRFTLSLEKA